MMLVQIAYTICLDVDNHQDNLGIDHDNWKSFLTGETAFAKITPK